MARNILLFSTNGESIHETFESPLSEKDSLIETRSADEVVNKLLTSRFDLFVISCTMFDNTYYHLFHAIAKYNLPTETIVVAKKGTVDDAVQAMKMGAKDFIIGKKVDKTFIEAILQKMEERDQASPLPANHSPEIGADTSVNLIGTCRAMSDVRAAIDLVANSQAAVMITGESGTGKEIVARLIHNRGKRKDKPFVVLNSAALPKDVVENELFGHERGAFTGAVAKRQGAFELANGGTLFFDEIAEMNMDMQAKLLRAIENKSYRRLGGKDEIHVDVRIIAATNKKIADAFQRGEFREDLYYRFSVIEIYVPPLRERPEDIPLLIDHFLSIFTARYDKPPRHFTPEAMKFLQEYNWPGNVRELKNIVERAVITCSDASIDAEYLSSRITSFDPPKTCIPIPLGSSFADAERMLITQTLATVKNNKSEAARILGLSRKTLHNKLKQYPGVA